MKINEKDFFHQATIRICGNLEIDKALMQSFQYLKDVMPLDEMWLTLLHEDLQSMRAIAIADANGVKKMYSTIPLPEIIREKYNKHGFIPKKVTIINRMEAHNLSDTIGYPESSVMVFPVLPEGAGIGVLIMRVAGINKYTDTHAKMLALLHDPFAIAMSNTLKHAEVLRLKDMLADDCQYLTKELSQIAGDEIIGAESGLKNVMDMVHQIAQRDNPVLLLGETGVGKEVIANAIHYASPRKNGPFIKVNSGAIPEGLIDSELFGHEKGAFTGAIAQNRGRFERAHGGTIFLDEIGDLPVQAQSRLLRVLQQKEFERVGGTKTITVDTRIIAATHRNLEKMVGENKFREDLWYRLNVFPIMIPPLRQRKSDIPALVKHFLKRKSRQLNFRSVPPVAPGAIDQLMEYPWKGNVRELENVVERALIQYSGGLLSFGCFIFSQMEDAPVLSGVYGSVLKLDEVNARHIQKVLELTHGKINGPEGAADLLGLHKSTLRSRMDKLGISYGRKKHARPYTPE